MTITRLALGLDDLAVSALAAGAASTADKARNPTIFNARLKIWLDMMEMACFWVAMVKRLKFIEMEKSRTLKSLRDFPKNALK